MCCSPFKLFILYISCISSPPLTLPRSLSLSFPCNTVSPPGRCATFLAELLAAPGVVLHPSANVANIQFSCSTRKLHTSVCSPPPRSRAAGRSVGRIHQNPHPLTRLRVSNVASLWHFPSSDTDAPPAPIPPPYPHPRRLPGARWLATDPRLSPQPTRPPLFLRSLPRFTP